MSHVETAGEHQRTLREELANSISHGVGLLAALIAVPFLVVANVQRGGARGIVSASIFGATVILLYLASTVYHALRDGRAKQLLEVLDNSAIFLLIAGTYTPFTLGVLRGAWGWSIFGVVWGLATAGLGLYTVGGLRHPVLFACLYLGLGWLVLVAIYPLSQRMPLPGIVLLIAGGLSYSVGVAFYAARKMRYGHLIWHLFVLMGTVFHFLAVLWYSG
jgi:hemolysin III